MSGEDYVDNVIAPALGQDFARIEKIVFVVCNLTPDKETRRDKVAGKSVDSVRDINDRGFLLSAMLKLNSAGIRPKIIGWDSYISALPHVPEGNSVYRAPKKQGKALDQSAIDAALGSKIGHGARYGLISDDYRKQFKRAFWIENGKFHVSGVSGWSDQ